MSHGHSKFLLKGLFSIICIKNIITELLFVFFTGLLKTFKYISLYLNISTAISSSNVNAKALLNAEIPHVPSFFCGYNTMGHFAILGGIFSEWLQEAAGTSNVTLPRDLSVIRLYQSWHLFTPASVQN